MEIKVTHQGRVLHEIEITPDAQLHIRSVCPPPESGGPGAPQYVWGSQGAGGASGAPQYVWGSGQAGPPPAPQYVWGATNDRVGGTYQRAVSVDRPGRPGAGSLGDGLGANVTDGLVQ